MGGVPPAVLYSAADYIEVLKYIVRCVTVYCVTVQNIASQYSA